MDNEINNWKKKMCKVELIIFFLIIIVGVFILMFTHPVNAADTLNSTLNVTYVSSTSITWHYTYLTANRPLGATLDGIDITGFKTDLVYNYTANDLKPNTKHEFCLYGEVTKNCEVGTTLDGKTSQDLVWDFIYDYWIMFIAVIFMFIAIRIPFMGILAFLFSLLGLIAVLPKGNFITDMMYICVFFASMSITYIGVKK